MSLCLVKVTADLARRIEADPDLLEQLWNSEDDEPDPEIAAIDRERDTLFEDFLDVSREAERFPWMKKALEGVGPEIDFDYGYGNASS
ncbi:hypothetical protein [Actinoplanes utahensis]|uniref:Uncharacterized protein n=1 Tax=Actinoplanes utahensis TaxID=1869 RepID=A0A0A6UQ81_ACTUT|nr:hypothetical protein [Actinoplanes utahensis]KHD76539.1 hypothetical protein MB27_16145 [Actinoplanes utahensis]GIF31212.1 hypothetical protein Aut01nite_41980 [Actinoplanes utahensis]